MTIRTDTPYLDEHAGCCDGCRNWNIGPLVRTGEVLTLGEDAYDDVQSIHPESNSACLCRPCILKAFACFDGEGKP